MQHKHLITLNADTVNHSYNHLWMNRSWKSKLDEWMDGPMDDAREDGQRDKRKHG